MPFTFIRGHEWSYTVFENGIYVSSIFVRPDNYYKLNSLSTNLCKEIMRNFFNAFPNYPILPLHKDVYNDNSYRYVVEEILLD